MLASQMLVAVAYWVVAQPGFAVAAVLEGSVEVEVAVVEVALVIGLALDYVVLPLLLGLEREHALVVGRPFVHVVYFASVVGSFDLVDLADYFQPGPELEHVAAA